MDILNWLYLAKNKFVRTTLGSTKDLMIFGAKVGFNKRGDLYQNYAMSAEDFTTEVANTVKPYKVYTALLTQSGGDNLQNLLESPLTIGVTYTIDGYITGDDFTNVGAPNNDNGTSFVATGTTPNSYNGGTALLYNTGAPVATVLENTIGNVWFEFGDNGVYYVKSNNLFSENKTYLLLGGYSYNIDGYSLFRNSIYWVDTERLSIMTQTISGDEGTFNNGILYNTPIEIRVYN